MVLSSPRMRYAFAPALRPDLAQGLSGWPKLHLQVWSVDSEGRTDICGYGFVTLPTAPGMYNLECPTWVPEGTACAQRVSITSDLSCTCKRLIARMRHHHSVVNQVAKWLWAPGAAM